MLKISQSKTRAFGSHRHVHHLSTNRAMTPVNVPGLCSEAVPSPHTRTTTVPHLDMATNPRPTPGQDQSPTRSTQNQTISTRNQQNQPHHPAPLQSSAHVREWTHGTSGPCETGNQ